MASMEHIEKLREKANVSYTEAKAALDACGDDLLEALLYLERQGKVKPPQNGGYYSSKGEYKQEKSSAASSAAQGDHTGETFSQLMGRFFRWVRDAFKKGCENQFEVKRGNSNVMTMPVIVLVLLLIFCFYIVIPLLIIGLFFGCRYRFVGRDVEKTSVNKVMETAENAAEAIKTDIRDAVDNSRNTPNSI